MREGSAIFTLAFYRQLSHSIPIPTLAHGERWQVQGTEIKCLGTQTASHPPNCNGSQFKSTRWEGRTG